MPGTPPRSSFGFGAEIVEFESERAKEAGDNSFNFGSQLRKGAIGRGKHRGRADVAAHTKK